MVKVLCEQPALLAMTSLTIVKQAILPLHGSSVLTSQISPSTAALKIFLSLKSMNCWKKKKKKKFKKKEKKEQEHEKELCRHANSKDILKSRGITQDDRL